VYTESNFGLFTFVCLRHRSSAYRDLHTSPIFPLQALSGDLLYVLTVPSCVSQTLRVALKIAPTEFIPSCPAISSDRHGLKWQVSASCLSRQVLVTHTSVGRLVRCMLRHA